MSTDVCVIKVNVWFLLSLYILSSVHNFQNKKAIISGQKNHSKKHYIDGRALKLYHRNLNINSCDIKFACATAD